MPIKFERRRLPAEIDIMGIVLPAVGVVVVLGPATRMCVQRARTVIVEGSRRSAGLGRPRHISTILAVRFLSEYA